MRKHVTIYHFSRSADFVTACILQSSKSTILVAHIKKKRKKKYSFFFESLYPSYPEASAESKNDLKCISFCLFISSLEACKQKLLPVLYTAATNPRLRPVVSAERASSFCYLLFYFFLIIFLCHVSSRPASDKDSDLISLKCPAKPFIDGRYLLLHLLIENMSWYPAALCDYRKGEMLMRNKRSFYLIDPFPLPPSPRFFSWSAHTQKNLLSTAPLT